MTPYRNRFTACAVGSMLLVYAGVAHAAPPVSGPLSAPAPLSKGAAKAVQGASPSASPSASILRLACAGVETIETIYGTELEPPRKGDFRVEYTFDLAKKTVSNARTGLGTPVNITEDEINFGSATDYHPGAKEEPTVRTIGPGAAATGVVIDRKQGKYFSIATRKRSEPATGAAAAPAASAASAPEPVQITNIRTRQGVCTNGTPSESF